MAPADPSAKDEQVRLVLVAKQIERLHASITVPSTAADQPGRTAASTQLTALAHLLGRLSGEIVARSVETTSRPGPDRVMGAYTDACRQVGEAVAHYTTAYAELGFQQKYRDTGPDLRDARKHPVAVVEDRFEWTCQRLVEAAHLLRTAAEDLNNTSRRPRRQAVPPAPQQPNHRSR